MAQTISYSASGGLCTGSVTLAATATNCTRIDIPVKARFCQIRVLSSADAAENYRVSHTGTDGSALGAGTYFTVLAGETFTLPPAIGEDMASDATRSIYVTGTSASALLHYSMGELTE